MSSESVRLASFNELPGFIDRLIKGQVQIVRKSVSGQDSTNAVIRTIQREIRETKPYQPRYSNKMYNSFRVHVFRSGEVSIINDQPYSGAMEEGSPPFIPDFRPIANWVATKSGVSQTWVSKIAKFPRIMDIGHTTKKQPVKRSLKIKRSGPIDSRIRQFAGQVKGLRTKIARTGLDGRFFVARALPDIGDKVLQIIDRDLKRNR